MAKQLRVRSRSEPRPSRPAWRASSVHGALSALLSLGAGCAPDFADSPALLAAERILAVQSEPAESRLGERVRYRALVAGPAGPVAEPALDWSFCTAPKPLAENNSVNALCLSEAAPIETSTVPGEVSARTPSDACRRFGPDTPPGDFRPRAPDQTGGYFLPLRIDFGGRPTIALERIRCNLADAPPDVARAYQEQYVANQNPRLLRLGLRDPNGTALPPSELAVGTKVALEAEIDPASAERFVFFDPARRVLAAQQERLTVTWFVTAGRVSEPRSPVIEGRAGTAFVATEDGPVHFFAILRDSRGGLSFATLAGVSR